MNPRSRPKTGKKEGRCVSATKTTQKYVTEVEIFKKDSANPRQGIDYLRFNTDNHVHLQNISEKPREVPVEQMFFTSGHKFRVKLRSETQT